MYMVGKDVKIYITTEDPVKTVPLSPEDGRQTIPVLPTGATTLAEFEAGALQFSEVTSIDFTFEKEWQENDFFGRQAKEWIELREACAGTIEKKLTDLTFQKSAWDNPKGALKSAEQDTVNGGYRIYLKQTDGVTDVWHTLTNNTLKKATPKPDPVNSSTETIEFDAKWGKINYGSGASSIPYVAVMDKL